MLHLASRTHLASVTQTRQLADYLVNGELLPTTYQRQSTVKVTIAGSSVQINNAFVTTADIVASNGVVDIIDIVLTVPMA